MVVKTSCLAVSAWMGGKGHMGAVPGAEAPGWLQVSPHQRMCPCSSLCHLPRGQRGFLCPPWLPPALCHLLR